jgi:hypothetical protein
MRAPMSDDPPAVKGTMMLTGLVGYPGTFCDQALIDNTDGNATALDKSCRRVSPCEIDAM